MNYQENKEFLNYFIENVINDIKSTILTLEEETIIETKYFVFERRIVSPCFFLDSSHIEITKDDPRPEYIYEKNSNGIEKNIMLYYYEHYVMLY